jgi:hypothetical protein
MSKLSPSEVSILQSIDQSLKIMGSYPARTLGGTGHLINLDVRSISIREDATAFTTLVCTDGTTTLNAAYFLGGAAATKATDMYRAPEGFRFTEIKLSAGSVQITGPNVTGEVSP